MREILFRAKHIHKLPQNEHLDGTWVYGYLCDENYINSSELEGDILSGKRYHDFGQGGECVPDKCVIKWNEKRAAFEPVYCWDWYSHDLRNYEVIGNIFDNPGMEEGAE